MTSIAYLAGLHLAGRRVVVVGAGTVATRRVERLLAAEAELVVVAPDISDAIARLAEDGRLTLRLRRFRNGDLADAWYAMAATDDPAVNAAVVAEADASRVFCVRADDGAAGTAVTPATAVVDGSQVGVLSGGDPVRSRRLRDLIVAQLDRWLRLVA